MHLHRFSAAANGERRLLCKWERESGFGEHVGDFGRDWKGTYLEGMKRKGILDKMTAAVAGAMQIILRGGDAIYDGIIGRKYKAPHGIAGNTRRDVIELGGDLFHLRLLHAAGDVWKLATSSVPQDIWDLLARVRLSNQRHSIREQIASALTPSTPSHPTASLASKPKPQPTPVHEAPPVLAV